LSDFLREGVERVRETVEEDDVLDAEDEDEDVCHDADEADRERSSGLGHGLDRRFDGRRSFELELEPEPDAWYWSKGVMVL
jgi:hypothetical protein